MSKERLEEIRHQLEESNSYDDNPNGYWYNAINWLIAQAERVQELESEYRVRQTECLEEHIDRLEKANKRYREAIEKAMDELNHGCKYHAHYVLEQTLEGEE